MQKNDPALLKHVMDATGTQKTLKMEEIPTELKDLDNRKIKLKEFVKHYKGYIVSYFNLGDDGQPVEEKS